MRFGVGGFKKLHVGGRADTTELASLAPDFSRQ
jgi:hypothetical protein